MTIDIDQRREDALWAAYEKPAKEEFLSAGGDPSAWPKVAEQLRSEFARDLTRQALAADGVLRADDPVYRML